MTHDQVAELRMLMSDPKTFITLHTNNTEDGRLILNGSAAVRHDSRFRDNFLNPSRSYHNLPHYIVKTLEWTAWPVKGEPLGTRYKAHDTTAPLFACGFTIRELVTKTPTRDNVDILSGAGETVSREIDSYESLMASLGIEEDDLTEDDLTEDDLTEDDLTEDD
jgi:hypothetical protein